jgi:hypothetical protein
MIDNSSTQYFVSDERVFLMICYNYEVMFNYFRVVTTILLFDSNIFLMVFSNFDRVGMC